MRTGKWAHRRENCSSWRVGNHRRLRGEAGIWIRSWSQVGVWQAKTEEQALPTSGWVLEELGKMMYLWVRLSNNSFPHGAYFIYLKNPWIYAGKEDWDGFQMWLGATPSYLFLLSLLLAPFHLEEAAPRQHQNDKEKNNDNPPHRPKLQQCHMTEDLWDCSEIHQHPAIPAFPGHRQMKKTRHSHTLSNMCGHWLPSWESTGRSLRPLCLPGVCLAAAMTGQEARVRSEGLQG